MGIFNKKKEPTFYELESEKLQEKLLETEPNSPEYDALITKLTKLEEIQGKRVERKQHFTKEGRGNIVGRVVGIIGLGGLAFGLARFEKNGNMFSGSSNGVISSIVKLGAKLAG